MVDLKRYIQAQNENRTFEQAIKELDDGRKQNQWMWCVFPRIFGLDQAKPAKAYDIKNLSDAESYIKHPILSKRYIKVCEIVSNKLNDGIKLEDLFDGSLDAKNFISSLTLFYLASRGLKNRYPHKFTSFHSITNKLQKHVIKLGFKLCQVTKDIIKRSKNKRRLRPNAYAMLQSKYEQDNDKLPDIISSIKSKNYFK